MKVVFQYQGLITNQYKEFFKSNVPDGVELVFSEHSDPDKLSDDIIDAEILVGYRLSEKLIESANKLKHIQIPWTGFNNLGRDLVKNKTHLTISNSHSNSLAIAEHAVALLCSVAKLTPYRHNQMKKGDWTSRQEDINSFWLSNKTTGILGYGAIGEKIARMMKLGFNSKIYAMRRNIDDYDPNDQIVDFKGGPEDLEEIIEISDFLFVAVPLTTETEGLISKNEFTLMKETALVVNIARGPVIDEESLFTALKSQSIGGAGIDTWYNYPSGGKNTEVFQNYPFEELENIVMSPHSAFKVRDRVEVFSGHILDNIKRLYEGKPPINQVNLDLGY